MGLERFRRNQESEKPHQRKVENIAALGSPAVERTVEHSEDSTPRYYHDERKQIIDLIESGGTPSMENGWSFVLEPRPVGLQDGHIPIRRFTEYFANRQVPIAAVDTNYFLHDAGHVPSYERLMAHAEFADLIAAAAQNSLADYELTDQFATAIDGFSDGTIAAFKKKPRSPFGEDYPAILTAQEETRMRGEELTLSMELAHMHLPTLFRLARGHELTEDDERFYDEIIYEFFVNQFESPHRRRAEKLAERNS